MTFLKTLFRREPDPAEALRPLWHRVVALSRDPAWYDECHVPDTVQGRFDMITLVLAMVLLRMEREEALRPGSTWLTELFVADMDGQLRETGMGDPTLGKEVGKLVSVLGGRLGALREANGDVSQMTVVIDRNMAIPGGSLPVATRLAAFAQRLAETDAEAVLRADIAL
ncbi:ubiquinol-cytochrome C chaperone family protein [Altererythrobacter sp. H2]|uniref:ubiquinol-cytochrome C chaperone family protein n=1 Tax=Altererythrobacter sp. H2 TaxID=3108391 RepID=UPI000BCC323D|nr:ubiquinol-cytochrome C chaperone family protein [Altererythrobacter sp. H2]OZA93992.1 MAG: hypothetical protein B7X57_03120 [Erythrobacter sp. 34-65-8]WRK95418.1 ubiquinol-cytochrome C chaperone family protein [Altererythrobacter sp. H2]